jgi:TonB family protein
MNFRALVLRKTIVLVAFAFLGVCASAQEPRKAINKPQPVYPEIAKSLLLKGTVRIEVIIGVDGEIKSAKVVGGHPVLAQAAMDAVRKWRYAPAKTETTETLEFNFERSN